LGPQRSAKVTTEGNVSTQQKDRATKEKKGQQQKTKQQNNIFLTK
jgi:hypothetical protein